MTIDKILAAALARTADRVTVATTPGLRPHVVRVDGRQHSAWAAERAARVEAARIRLLLALDEVEADEDM
jgi:hypothetical protein